MDNERRKSFGLWVLVAVIAMPLVYVLSSGPMQTATFRRYVTHHRTAPGRVQARAAIDPGHLWPKVYAPLIWASDQTWGDALNSYWRLFPIPRTAGPP
jgi:hypothetical protein